MKRMPKAGDVVMIGKSTKPMLVVDATNHVSEDRLRGDAYYASTFTVIGEDKTGVVNPKTKMYVLEGASMNMASTTTISLDDIYLVDTIKLKKTVKTEVIYTRK